VGTQPALVGGNNNEIMALAGTLWLAPEGVRLKEIRSKKDLLLIEEFLKAQTPAPEPSDEHEIPPDSPEL